MIDTARLADISVADPDGGRVRLGDLWMDGPAVVVWLRHFGCMFCREQTAEFRARAADITARGASLVLVGNGGLIQARDFRDRYCPGCTLLTDPDLTSYRAIGARGGVLNTVGPRAWASGIRALRRGARQRSVQGHAFQQGGVLVLAPGNRVLFSYISEAAGDHPKVDDVLAALPATGARTRRAG